jgi:hypothetical protein
MDYGLRTTMNDTSSGPDNGDRALEALYSDIGISDEEFESRLNRGQLANCHWGVYQMLGKLCPAMYVLEPAL